MNRVQPKAEKLPQIAAAAAVKPMITKAIRNLETPTNDDHAGMGTICALPSKRTAGISTENIGSTIVGGAK